MSQDLESVDEHTRLLPHVGNHSQSVARHIEEDSQSVDSLLEIPKVQNLSPTHARERLPYNDYLTVDLLHDLAKDSHRYKSAHVKKGLRDNLSEVFESSQGWIAAVLMGSLTSLVAFLVDVSEASVSDWKTGYCSTNVFLTKENCCKLRLNVGVEGGCEEWHFWVSGFWESFSVYLGFALSFGIISASATTYLTKSSMPCATPQQGGNHVDSGKTIYLAAGSGIPEIKTILCGFAIPHLLSFKVLAVKAFGAVFAVATGMCLGKEGPFVHISTCIAYLIGNCLPKYRDNGRKMRELLSAGCSSGLCVAFGAPIGGVLFSYEEISTHFPRKVLWRAFFSSLISAAVLRALNPMGTGRLVLFETNYGTSYSPVHYLIFILLGVVGGLFGGVFCKANFSWSKNFRKHRLIKDHPVLEVFLVVLATVFLQYPNPMTREPGDIILKNILVNCHDSSESWICRMESGVDRSKYKVLLLYGSLVKLVLTTITFGCKVPSGIIIPALNGGAFFGRLVGQSITGPSPGIFAMVGAAAFLAGISRMTISLCVIMFELTGELEYIVPNMIAILVAKWVADSIESQGVYDIAQTLQGHPFLDLNHSMSVVQKQHAQVDILIPPKQTMEEITLNIPQENMVTRRVLDRKLQQLKQRGLLDAGLALVQHGMLQGYLTEEELDSQLSNLGATCSATSIIRLLGRREDGDFDLSRFVDRTPLTISAAAPVEYAVEMFGKLGLRYLCVVEEGTGKFVGVIVKKRLVAWLEGLNH